MIIGIWRDEVLIGRREFITLVSSAAAAAWPIGAHAQQQAMPVVGFINGQKASDFMHLVAAFRDGLKSRRICRRP